MTPTTASTSTTESTASNTPTFEETPCPGGQGEASAIGEASLALTMVFLRLRLKALLVAVSVALLLLVASGAQAAVAENEASYDVMASKAMRPNETHCYSAQLVRFTKDEFGHIRGGSAVTESRPVSFCWSISVGPGQVLEFSYEIKNYVLANEHFRSNQLDRLTPKAPTTVLFFEGQPGNYQGFRVEGDTFSARIEDARGGVEVWAQVAK